MGTVIYGAGCSLDGYIADVDGGTGWLRWSGDAAAISAATLRDVDTMVMGRGTYEAALAAGTRAYAGYATYVFSRTLPPGARAGVEVLAEDAAPWVSRRKSERPGGICVLGGGRLAAALLAAGVVDVVGLNIHPLLLGAGVPMFRPTAVPLPLELVESRAIEGGCVYALYRTRAGAA